MKQYIYKLTMVVAAIALFTGCMKTTELIKDSAQTPQVEDLNQGEETDDVEAVDEAADQGKPGLTVNDITFEVVDLNTLPDQIKDDVELYKLQRGYEYWLQEDGSYLIFISAGEKSTGGYGISVEAIEDNEGKTIITVMESEPTGEATIQVITYPYIMIKAKGITDQFNINDQNGVEYTRISLTEVPTENGSDNAAGSVLRYDESFIDYSKPFLATYQGQIDNHSIEVLYKDSYLTFSADDIGKSLNDIKTGDTVEITVEIAPNDAILLKKIVKVQ
jgi:hypothetical protein